jgi:hypothetical protein
MSTINYLHKNKEVRPNSSNTAAQRFSVAWNEKRERANERRTEGQVY